MQLIDFADACGLSSRTDQERFVLLCYYQAKEEDAASFSVKRIIGMFSEAGLHIGNEKALMKSIKKHDSFVPFGIEGTLKFRRDAFKVLEKEYGHLWSGSYAPRDSDGTVPLTLSGFVSASGLASMDDEAKFAMFCYYLAKEKNETAFRFGGIAEMFGDAGLSVGDAHALEKRIRKGRSFTVRLDGSFTFSSDVFSRLDAQYGGLWTAGTKGPVRNAGEVLSEEMFCGKRETFDRLIEQINSSYRDGYYDACALVMRRLLETALVLAFHVNGMENETKDENGGTLCLADLVAVAVKKNELGLSGMTDQLASVSGIGSYSGRGPTYVFGANDINNVRSGYRNVLETLFKASKLL